MLNLKLPAPVRNKAREMVRAHPDFEAFRMESGNWDSRKITKGLLLEAIERFGFENTVRHLLEEWNRLGTVDGIAPDFDAPNEEEEEEAEPIGVAIAADVSAMREAVLEPLRPFLGESLLATVANRLAPLVALANKPATIVEKQVERIVTQTVTLDATGVPVAVTKKASRVDSSTLGKLFGLGRSKHSTDAVGVWDHGDPDGNFDPCWVPDPSLLPRFASAIERGRDVWMAGVSGGGKSTLPKQYAAVTGRPFVEAAFQRAIEPVDLIGMKDLDGKGGMVWADGLIARAIRKPGTIILIDEPTMAPPGILAVLQTLMSSRGLTIHATGEHVPCADGVVFVLADNTTGNGDQSGLYAGTMQANAALVDRVARMFIVGYLSPALEAQALANKTLASRAACEYLVNWVARARKLPGFEARPLSLRRMIAFIEMVQDNFTTREAIEDCMLSRLPDAEREALNAHFVADFKDAEFMAALTGTPVPVATPTSPVPGSDAPEQVRARGSFDPIP